MELGHLLTRSGLTYPEVSSKVYRDSIYQLGSSVSLPWVIYFEAFYLHVVSSFSCIPVICPKLVLFLAPLQFVHLFCNPSKCILLFFSRISSVLLLFFWCHLHEHGNEHLVSTEDKEFLNSWCLSLAIKSTLSHPIHLRSKQVIILHSTMRFPT